MCGSGAAVVAVFIHRQPDGTHLLRVVKPDLPSRSEADVLGREAWQTKVTARLTALIESEVRAFPAEWVWWHQRWS